MKKLFLATIILLIALVANSQTDYKTEVVKTLREIRNTIGTIGDKTPAVQNIVSECRTAINDALVNINEYTENFPDVYATAVKDILETCKSVWSEDASAQGKFFNLLLRDLKLKFQFRSHNLTTFIPSDLIDVKVVTKMNGHEVKNLRIRYTGLGYKVDYAHPGNNFKNLSSPVTEKMVPGLYEMWVTKDGSFEKLQSLIVEVSPDIVNSIQFDLK